MRNKITTIFVQSLLLFVLAAPAALAKGTVDFTLERPLEVGGKVVAPGSYKVSWVSHSPETDVSFTRRGKVVAEARGKMVERDAKSEADSLVTVKDSNGKDVLKEIRFAGKKTAIVIE